MKDTDFRTEAARAKAHRDLFQKGVLVAFIGLAVLFAPRFMRSSELSSIVANSYLVGWFALVLGIALAVRALLCIRSQRKKLGSK
jgi:uncharacterized membrane protein HdeD (DUF308 family)